MEYRIPTDRLLQAADKVASQFNRDTRNQPWELTQSIVEDFTDDKGRKYTLKVMIQAFDERPGEEA